MSKDMNKGIAVGLLVGYFLIGAVFSAVGFGKFAAIVTVIAAAYFYFFKK